MKNYVKEGQKLPLFGIGPYLVLSMTAITALGIVLAVNWLPSGNLEGAWRIVFWVLGGVLIIYGGLIWLISGLCSGTFKDISENRLKTNGLYAWVRNPMYGGCWILLIGVALIPHNLWLLIIPLINWLLLTYVLKNTEEKWLLQVYGDEYAIYRDSVNRLVPWPRKKEKNENRS